jgi:magnesium-transporting ATPase (P-type)
VGIIDPPRQEAIDAVAQCGAAGIRVVMITGDHGVTASAIAAQLGMGGDLTAITGPEVETMDDAALCEVVRTTRVFARASPEHKLRLVRALQANGEIVAMTGDGVNDAPALKQADVGVAMGMKGTEAAKQAGAIVLADDNFASIAHAVEEGRTVYDNLRKTVTFLLPINGGESLSLLLAVLIGVALPIAPAQILWVNMVSSIALALVLAFEPTEADVMRRPPRRPDEPMLRASCSGASVSSRRCSWPASSACSSGRYTAAPRSTPRARSLSTRWFAWRSSICSACVTSRRRRSRCRASRARHACWRPWRPSSCCSCFSPTRRSCRPSSPQPLCR